MTFSVHPDLVRGTLREAFAIGRTLPQGLPRAIFEMFRVAEVHPFADGNGRVARRVMIPLPVRDEYLGALRALSQNANPTPIWRSSNAPNGGPR